MAEELDVVTAERDEALLALERLRSWSGLMELLDEHYPSSIHVQYSRPRHPLLELGMSRKDCARWLAVRGWASVAKSACVGCPFHGNRQWRDLRDNYPAEWADAVEFDQAIRKGGARGLPLTGEAFLHRSRIPLDIAPINRVTRGEWKDRQGDLLDTIADIEAGVDEDGDLDGCSPYGCRSGTAVSAGPFVSVLPEEKP